MIYNSFNEFNNGISIESKIITQEPSILIQEGLFSFFKNLFTRARFSKESLLLKQKGESIVGSDNLEASIDPKTLRFKQFTDFRNKSVRDIADNILGNLNIRNSKFLNSYLTLLFKELMLEEEYYKAQVSLKEMRKNRQLNTPQFDELQTRTEILADRIKNAREALNRAKKSNIEYIQNEFEKLVDELKNLAEKHSKNPKRVKELVAVKDILENRLSLIKVALTNLELDIRQSLIPEGNIENDPLFKELSKFKEEFININKQMNKSVSDLTQGEIKPTTEPSSVPNNLTDLREAIDVINRNIISLQSNIRQRESVLNSAKLDLKGKKEQQKILDNLNLKLKEQQLDLAEHQKKLSSIIKPVDSNQYIETINTQKQIIYKLESELKQKEEDLRNAKEEKKDKIESQIDKLESKVSEETKKAEATVINFVIDSVKDTVNNPDVNKAKSIDDSDTLKTAKDKLIKAGFAEEIVNNSLQKIIDSKEPFKSVEELIDLAINNI